MFFGSRKKKKLAEEARQKEQQRIQEEAAQKVRQELEAHSENLATFYRICNMVRSLPQKRHIVVVQRENIFIDDHDRNWRYLKIARKMQSVYNRTGQRWISDYGIHNDCLYAFYEPTKLTLEFNMALEKFSKDGCRIQRIRYYSQNL